MNKCKARQCSDQMQCECGNRWDVNDPYPPECAYIEGTKVNWALVSVLIAWVIFWVWVLSWIV